MAAEPGAQFLAINGVEAITFVEPIIQDAPGDGDAEISNHPEASVAVVVEFASNQRDPDRLGESFERLGFSIPLLGAQSLIWRNRAVQRMNVRAATRQRSQNFDIAGTRRPAPIRVDGSGDRWVSANMGAKQLVEAVHRGNVGERRKLDEVDGPRSPFVADPLGQHHAVLRSERVGKAGETLVVALAEFFVTSIHQRDGVSVMAEPDVKAGVLCHAGGTPRCGRLRPCRRYAIPRSEQ